MKSRRSIRIEIIAAALGTVNAALLLGTRLVPGLGWLTLPVSWPGFIILGADETQERYGY